MTYPTGTELKMHGRTWVVLGQVAHGAWRKAFTRLERDDGTIRTVATVSIAHALKEEQLCG